MGPNKGLICPPRGSLYKKSFILLWILAETWIEFWGHVSPVASVAWGWWAWLWFGYSTSLLELTKHSTYWNSFSSIWWCASTKRSFRWHILSSRPTKKSSCQAKPNSHYLKALLFLLLFYLLGQSVKDSVICRPVQRQCYMGWESL